MLGPRPQSFAPPQDELQGRGGEGDFVRLWTESAASSIFELFGTTPDQHIRDFRTERPMAGFASQLAGAAIPYAGWWRATKAIGPLNRALTLGKEVRKSRPLLSSVAREPLRFAPLEAARVGSSVFVDGGDQLEETVGSAAINLGAGAALGAVGGFISHAGRRITRIEDLTQSNAPAAVIGRKLEREIELGNFPEENIEHARQTIESLVLSESVKPTRQAGGKMTRTYIGALEGVDDKTVWGRFNAIFNEQATDRRYSSQLLPDLGTEKMSRVLKEARLDRQKLFSVQFPRFVSAKDARGKAALDGLLRGRDGKHTSMTWVDDTTGYMREESGMYVVAKKVEDGYLTFKTDDPKIVSAQADLVHETIASQISFWHPHQHVDERIGAELHDGLVDIREQMDDLALDMVANTPDTQIARLLNKSEAFRKSWFALKKYFAPTDLKITDPLARKAWALSSIAHDAAVSRHNGILNGHYKVQAGKNPIHSLAGIKPTEGYKGLKALRPLVEELDDGDLTQLAELLARPQMQEQLGQLVKEGAISQRVSVLVDQLQKYDDILWKEMKTIANAMDREVPDQLKGHLMLSRTWRGNERIPVTANIRGVNQTVWLASGKTTKQAQQEADAVIKALRDEKVVAAQGKPYTTVNTGDLGKLLEPGRSDVGELILNNNPYTDRVIDAALNSRKAANPEFFKARRKMPGAMGDYVPGMSKDRAPWTRNDVLEILSGHIQRQQSFVAELSAQRATQTIYQRLNDMGRNEELLLLKESVERMFGRQGEVAALVNQVSDTVLGGVMGSNSANKIAGGINQLLYQFTLAMGNPVYPAVNMLTFTQTVMPHITFLSTAAPKDLHKYYATLTVADTQGRARRGMGMLDAFKLTRQGFKRLGNPTGRDRKLMERAINDGVMQPVLADEAIGPESMLRKRFHETVMEGNVIERISALSEWAPRYTEQFARGHSFATALAVGEDIFRIQDEERLYQFAREFVTKTMLKYGPGDRAGIITGPVGTSYGLFKNWMMHQMGWMLAYAGVGARDLAQGKGAAGFAPLLMLAAGTATVGGIGAMPGSFALDWMSRLDDDKTFQQHLYSWLAGDEDGDTGTADMVYYGLPSMLGMSIQGSASSVFADPVRDASSLVSSVTVQRAQALGKVIGGAVERGLWTDQAPGESERVRDALVQAFAPRSIQRLIQGAEGDYIRSLNTGNPTVAMTPQERFLYSIGFNPVAVDKAYAVQSELWRDQTRMRRAVQEFGRAVSEAQSEGDWDEVDQLIRRAIARGVPVDSVWRSADTRTQKDAATVLDRQFKPEDVAQFRHILGE